MPKLKAVETELEVDQPAAISEKRQRFLRVAGRRVRNVLGAIRLLDKLAGNAGYYEFSQSDVDKMIDKLHAEVDSLKQRLTAPVRIDQTDFEF